MNFLKKIFYFLFPEAKPLPRVKMVGVDLNDPKTCRWITYDGRRTTIGHMTDDHLANVIDHLLHYAPEHPYVFVASKEAFRRGLTEKFLKSTPIPFKDSNGDMVVWDFKTHRPEKVV